MFDYENRRRYLKNGYVVVDFPQYPKAFDTGTGLIGPYEHVLVAEVVILKRPLSSDEVVHHLDGNRSNNSPDNLLVLSNAMHCKLHGWMNNQVIVPRRKQRERQSLGCIRCLFCGFPVTKDKKFCTVQCYNNSKTSSRVRKILKLKSDRVVVLNEDIPINRNTVFEIEDKNFRIEKKDLEVLLSVKSKTKIAQEFGITAKALRDICLRLGIS